jgi:hypothetical protein
MISRKLEKSTMVYPFSDLPSIYVCGEMEEPSKQGKMTKWGTKESRVCLQVTPPFMRGTATGCGTLKPRCYHANVTRISQKVPEIPAHHRNL